MDIATHLRGYSLVLNDNFNRPDNATAYTAKDYVAATTDATDAVPLRKLTVARWSGGTGIITGVWIWTSKVALTPKFRLHLWRVGESFPQRLVGDNSPGAFSYVNRNYSAGYIDLLAMESPADGVDVSFAQNIGVRLPFQCLPAEKDLYYRLETLDAFAPEAGQGFHLRVAVEQD